MTKKTNNRSIVDKNLNRIEDKYDNLGQSTKNKMLIGLAAVFTALAGILAIKKLRGKKSKKEKIANEPVED